MLKFVNLGRGSGKSLMIYDEFLGDLNDRIRYVQADCYQKHRRYVDAKETNTQILDAALISKRNRHGKFTTTLLEDRTTTKRLMGGGRKDE